MFRMIGTSQVYAEVDGYLVPVNSEHLESGLPKSKIIEISQKEFLKFEISKTLEIKEKTL